jgi:RNA polymerase sigma-70 factor (ECF subfamily)
VSGDRALASVFASHWSGSPSKLSPELEEALAVACGGARVVWPALDLDDEAFVRHLAERVPTDADPALALSRLHLSDLFLACACVRRDPRAVAAFTDRYLAKTSIYLQHMNLLPAAVDEVRQILGEQLLAGGRLEDYAGRGALESWARIAAIRIALNQTRGEGRHREALRRFADESPASRDPELDFLKHRHRADFEAAFREAIACLSVQDRSLLRLRFLDGLGLAEIAAILGVHRSTVVRWLGSAETAVCDGTRRILRDRLRLHPSECDSLLYLLSSRLELTLHSLLKRSAGGS